MQNAARYVAITLCLSAVFTLHLWSEDLTGQIKKAVEKCTLDQPGTKPFHLKASIAPNREADRDSNRVGEIEIWWQAPNKWRREIQSPGFHQIAIVDGDRQWQKNDGDYFPEWLRELAVALVRPVPLPLDTLSKRVKTAEVRHLMGQTNIDWEDTSGFGDEQANGKGYLALNDKTGLLFYAGGPGFGGEYHDFKDFHGRMVAWTVGSVKVTALEDLGSTPTGFFDTNAPGGDPAPIDTVVLSEEELQKNLLPGHPFTWPPVQDGPFEGIVWTTVVLDRAGKVRDIDTSIADNPALKDAAAKGFSAMKFQPVLRNGVPVQATGRLSVRFKTSRPAGQESYASAREYFERGRKASFLAAGATAPYRLRAEFQLGTASGIQTGRYEDKWISATEWKREAWLGSGHLTKSQSADKRYVLAEGTESGILRMVMRLLEPIPAEDTMTESDWHIRRDTVDGVRAIRVFRGPEGPNGEPEPGRSEVFWFDDSGHLIKTYTAGFEVRLQAPEEYNGILVARRIDVLKDGKLGMRVEVKEIGAADTSMTKEFKLKGHEWQRAFTAEAR